jgi:hypothetical protein
MSKLRSTLKTVHEVWSSKEGDSSADEDSSDEEACTTPESSSWAGAKRTASSSTAHHGVTLVTPPKRLEEVIEVGLVAPMRNSRSEASTLTENRAILRV